MSCFLRKTLLFVFRSARVSTTTSNLAGSVRTPDVFSRRWFSRVSNQPSFAVSYLMREHGFSKKSALKASERLSFDTSEKPDEVIKLFKKYGFTRNQISAIFRRKPQLLVADAENAILPKLEFFDAKGVSWPQFAKRLSSFPSVLARSLDNQILPSYEFLKSFLRCDEKAIATVENYPDILVDKCLALNIDILREHGVPDSNIAKMIPRQAHSLTLCSDRFRQIVGEVVEMGFDPKRLSFVKAVLVLRGLSKSTWESKVNAYKRWGWSKEEVSKFFERYPWSMMLSEDKIMVNLDFYTNEMGLSLWQIANRPILLNLSLKKRLIPRFSVFQVLLSKGLVKNEVSPGTLLESSEQKFLQKFITPYEEKAPELLKLYKEKMNLPDKITG